MWRTFDIEPTPLEMAQQFWNWESGEQAKYLNELSLQWERLSWKGDGQILYISDEEITETTRKFIDALHEFLVRKAKKG